MSALLGQRLREERERIGISQVSAALAGTLTEPEEALISHYRDTDHEGRAAIDRMAAMEAQRVRHAPVPPGGTYPPASTASTAVLLHETKPRPKAVKRASTRKD